MADLATIATTAALTQFVSPAFKHLGEQALERAKQLGNKATALLQKAGIEPQPVPPKILLPLLENASLEEDEFLHRTWANLLANAASPNKQDDIDVGFVEIMKQITPTQVLILNALFPESRGGINGQSHVFQMDTEYIKEVVMTQGISQKQFDIAFDNLVRLRLCTASGVTSLIKAAKEATQQNYHSALAMAMGNGTANIGPTSLGISFLQACSPPETQPHL